MQGMMLAKQCHKPCLMPKFTIFMWYKAFPIGWFLIVFATLPQPTATRHPSVNQTPLPCLTQTPAQLAP